MVGGDRFDAAACHCHGGVGLEAGHAKECDQRAGDILADTTTVGVVHLEVMERVALALAHRDAGIADVVGYPVGEDGDLLHLGLFAPDQLVDFRLCLGDRLEAAVVLIDLVEPKGFLFPARG